MEFESSGQKYNQVVAQECLERYEAALEAAVGVAYPERKGQAPVSIFPNPSKPRNMAPETGWRADTVSAMRDILGELGVGHRDDENISALGLPGPVVAIVEAGLEPKVRTERELLENDTNANVTRVIFTGSAMRKISAQECANVKLRPEARPDGYTEYDMVHAMIGQMEGFQPLPQPEVLEQSYAVSRGDGFKPGTEKSGQFVRVGTMRNGAEVILMRIDGEDRIGHEGNLERLNQPEYGDVMRIVGDFLVAAGDQSSIAYITSNTYRVSRITAALQKSLELDRPVGVATYGTVHLAAVKGEKVPDPTPENQIPGELHVIAEAVSRLRKALNLDGADN